MFRSFAAGSGRTYVVLFFCTSALAVHAPHARAQSGDLVPWEDREEALDTERHATDVNVAPLYLLSAESAWGREGAGVIGRVRSEAAFASPDDFAARTGLSALPGYAYGEPGAGERWDWEWRTTSNGVFTGRSGRLAWSRGPWSIPMRWEGDGGLERWNDRRTAAVSWKRATSAFVIGHYDLRWGNGFLVDSSPGWGTPSRPTSDRKTRLRPYDSRVENRAFFGPAVFFDRGAWKLGGAFSLHQRDGRIDRDGLVSSWDEGGYHRTSSERRSRARVRETFASSFGEVAIRRATLSLAAFTVSYGPAWSGGSVERKPDAMRGDHSAGVSVGARLPLPGAEWSADVATTGGRDGLAGRLAMRTFGKRSLQVTWQRLGKRFHATRSGAYHRLRSSPRGQESALAIARVPSFGSTITLRLLVYRSLGRTFFEAGGESGAEFRAGIERGRLRLEWDRRREWESGEPEDRVRWGARIRLERRLAGLAGSVAPFWVAQREIREDGTRRAAGTGAVIAWGPLQVSLVRLLAREASLVLPAVTLGGSFPARSYGRTGRPWRVRSALRWNGPGRVEAHCAFAEGEWGVLVRKRGSIR